MTMERYVEAAAPGTFAIGAEGSRVVVKVIDYEGTDLTSQHAIILRALNSIRFAFTGEQVETTDHDHLPIPGTWRCKNDHPKCTAERPCPGCKAYFQLLGASSELERPEGDMVEPT